MSDGKAAGGDDAGEIAAEYDFSHGVRGKHARAMRDGYTMTIHKSDGATEVRTVTPPAGTVILDPDVRAYFPDSESVNRALRGLINLAPRRPDEDGAR